MSKVFWRSAVLAGSAWLVVLGATRIATSADEPRPPAAPSELPQPAIPLSKQKSGFEFQSKPNRDLQQDLTTNPGMLWVDQGASLWSEPAGTSGKSCRDCHGEPETMKGVATRYPAWDTKAQRMYSVETRIQECRTTRQGGEALKPESEPLLALATLVAHQSNGMVITAEIDGPARPAFDRGRALYNERVGQLNLSCAQCHEQNWGRRLRSEIVSQGHGNGYPIYRLEWQTLGSLHRRLRSCYLSVRSDPPAHGTDDHLALELYLAWRASGLKVETPAVRR